MVILSTLFDIVEPYINVASGIYEASDLGRWLVRDGGVFGRKMA